jgi:hypothetical protein
VVCMDSPLAWRVGGGREFGGRGRRLTDCVWAPRANGRAGTVAVPTFYERSKGARCREKEEFSGSGKPRHIYTDIVNCEKAYGLGGLRFTDKEGNVGGCMAEADPDRSVLKLLGAGRRCWQS